MHRYRMIVLRFLAALAVVVVASFAPAVAVRADNGSGIQPVSSFCDGNFASLLSQLPSAYDYRSSVPYSGASSCWDITAFRSYGGGLALGNYAVNFLIKSIAGINPCEVIGAATDKGRGGGIVTRGTFNSNVPVVIGSSGSPRPMRDIGRYCPTMDLTPLSTLFNMHLIQFFAHDAGEILRIHVAPVAAAGVVFPWESPSGPVVGPDYSGFANWSVVVNGAQYDFDSYATSGTVEIPLGAANADDELSITGEGIAVTAVDVVSGTLGVTPTPNPTDVPDSDSCSPLCGTATATPGPGTPTATPTVDPGHVCGVVKDCWFTLGNFNSASGGPIPYPAQAGATRWWRSYGPAVTTCPIPVGETGYCINTAMHRIEFNGPGTVYGSGAPQWIQDFTHSFTGTFSTSVWWYNGGGRNGFGIGNYCCGWIGNSSGVPGQWVQIRNSSDASTNPGPVSAGTYDYFGGVMWGGTGTQYIMYPCAVDGSDLSSCPAPPGCDSATGTCPTPVDPQATFTPGAGGSGGGAACDSASDCQTVVAATETAAPAGPRATATAMAGATPPIPLATQQAIDCLNPEYVTCDPSYTPVPPSASDPGSSGGTSDPGSSGGAGGPWGPGGSFNSSCTAVSWPVPTTPPDTIFPQSVRNIFGVGGAVEAAAWLVGGAWSILVQAVIPQHASCDISPIGAAIQARLVLPDTTSLRAVLDVGSPSCQFFGVRGFKVFGTAHDIGLDGCSAPFSTIGPMLRSVITWALWLFLVVRLVQAIERRVRVRGDTPNAV